MNDASHTSSVPPALPKSARSNLLGATALGIAIVSAGVTTGAIYMLREHARYVEGFPPGVISGGTAFSINFYPFVVTLASFALGLFGCCLLVTSCWLARLNRQPILSNMHIGAGVFLLPFLFLLCLFIWRILQ